MSAREIEKVAELQRRVLNSKKLQKQILKKIEDQKESMSFAKLIRIASQCNLDMN